MHITVNKTESVVNRMQDCINILSEISPTISKQIFLISQFSPLTNNISADKYIEVKAKLKKMIKW